MDDLADQNIAAALHAPQPAVMEKIDLRIAIGDAAGLGTPLEMAVTLYLPDRQQLPERPVLVFACPGGGYGRGYFDMRFEGHTGYSQAEHHTQHGVIVAAVDHIGVGDSSLPDAALIQFEALAAAHDACCRAVRDKLVSGAVGNDLPPVPIGVMVGIGQSMGGCVTLLTQAHHKTFDGIAVLGYSAIHTRLPQKTDAAQEANANAVHGVRRGDTSIGARDVTMQDYVYPFHWEDLPADILAADMAGGYPIRINVPPFGSATIPHCAVQMMIPGVVANEAAAITVPVFAGNGERDVAPDPRAEGAAYRASDDIRTVVIPRMAHMHNFASSRELLWDRLLDWYLSVAGRASVPR